MLKLASLEAHLSKEVTVLYFFPQVLAKREDNTFHLAVIEKLSYPALNARGPGVNYYTVIWAIQDVEPGQDLQRNIIAE